MLRMMTKLSVVGVLAFSPLTVRADQRAVASLEQLMPQHADIIVAVPNLKRASDHVTRLLEGMDRAGLLVGSRPIDQAKSLLGYAAAIDDQGWAACALMVCESGVQVLGWVVPVTDAEEFLQSNFTDANQPEAGARRSISGQIVYAQSRENHVIVCPSQHALNLWAEPIEPPRNGLLSRSDRFLGIGESDLAVCIRPDAVSKVFELLTAWASRYADMDFLRKRLGQAAVEGLMLSISFDPLAMIVRSEIRFVHDAAAPAANNSFDAAQPLALLPDETWAIGVGINMRSGAVQDTIRSMLEVFATNAEGANAILTRIQSVGIGILPSQTGGFLGRSVMVVDTQHPTAVRDGFFEFLRRSGREVEIKPQAGADSRTAFVVSPLEAPEHAEQIAAEALLFGASGVQGRAEVADDRLLMSVSPAAGLMDALSQPTRSLEANAAVAVIRQWLPQERDIEGYAHAAAGVEALQRVPPPLRPQASSLPAFDANAPPVGFGCDIRADGIISAAVVPAPVLAPILDHAIRWLRSRSAVLQPNP